MGAGMIKSSQSVGLTARLLRVNLWAGLTRIIIKQRTVMIRSSKCAGLTVYVGQMLHVSQKMVAI